MPSANKTANYGLNQWQGNEYPKRQDFVDDNAIIDAELKKAQNHREDTTAHVTQADHDKINGAVQSATIGGATVSKSGTTLQLPAYPTSLPANGGNAGTVGGSPATRLQSVTTEGAPYGANSYDVQSRFNTKGDGYFRLEIVGGSDAANYVDKISVGKSDMTTYSSHAVASSGAALRNNTATVGGSPSGGSDGDGWDICT